MKLTKQLHVIHMLALLIIFFTVSCTSSQPAESIAPTITLISVLTPAEQPVEYGASLDEWNAALNGDSVQPASSSSNGFVASSQSTINDLPETTTENSSSVTDVADTAVSSTIDSSSMSSDDIYQEIIWESLVPPEFSPDAIMAKYEDELAKFEDGSEEAFNLYTQMQEEFNNAPVNESLSGTLVKLPGFIAPLDYTDDLITEFLLVPYFGACIHVPPPPVNQTVLVSTSKENGIQLEDSFNPVWIIGRLTTEGTTTELAEAGYVMQDAIIEPYNEP